MVVASVFAFAILSTGLLSSEKSKETVPGGFEGTSAKTSVTMSLWGEVVAEANAEKSAIGSIKLW